MARTPKLLSATPLRAKTVQMTVEFESGQTGTYGPMTPTEAVELLTLFYPWIQYADEGDFDAAIRSAAQQIREAREDAKRPR